MTSSTAGPPGVPQEADTLSGGDGTDTVDYSQRVAALTVTLDDVQNDGEVGESDNVASDVENVIGGSAGDTLVGSGGPNVLDGRNGDDTLVGGGADDTLAGGVGNDTLSGGDGGDILTGADGDDALAGDDGNDSLSGGGGTDTLDGGAGGDALSGGAGIDTLNGGDGDDWRRRRGRHRLRRHPGCPSLPHPEGMVSVVAGKRVITVRPVRMSPPPPARGTDAACQFVVGPATDERVASPLRPSSTLAAPAPDEGGAGGSANHVLDVRGDVVALANLTVVLQINRA